MTENIEVRIDKFLWSIRLFKTRSLAADFIDSGKVRLGKDTVKSSRKVRIGDIYTIKRPEWVKEIKVKKLISKRVGATEALECYEILREVDMSIPRVESAFFAANIVREKGKGRPTKKDRRDIDKFRL